MLIYPKSVFKIYLSFDVFFLSECSQMFLRYLPQNLFRDDIQKLIHGFEQHFFKSKKQSFTDIFCFSAIIFFIKYFNVFGYLYFLFLRNSWKTLTELLIRMLMQLVEDQYIFLYLFWKEFSI